MITSNQIIKLSEEYFNTKKVHGFDVPVYRNPTSDEVKSLKVMNVGVRFIADSKSRKVYIWDASKSIHNEIFSFLVSLGVESWNNLDYCVNGLASVSNSGTLNFIVWDFADRPGDMNIDIVNYFKKISSQDWQWLDRHIPGASVFLTKKIIEVKKKYPNKF